MHLSLALHINLSSLLFTTRTMIVSLTSNSLSGSPSPTNHPSSLSFTHTHTHTHTHTLTLSLSRFRNDVADSGAHELSEDDLKRLSFAYGSALLLSALDLVDRRAVSLYTSPSGQPVYTGACASSTSMHALLRRF
jgi:hypothetical protein